MASVCATRFDNELDDDECGRVTRSAVLDETVPVRCRSSVAADAAAAADGNIGAEVDGGDVGDDGRWRRALVMWQHVFRMTTTATLWTTCDTFWNGTKQT